MSIILAPLYLHFHRPHNLQNHDPKDNDITNGGLSVKCVVWNMEITPAQHETTSYLCETVASSCYKWFILIYMNALCKPKHQSVFVACDGDVAVTIIEYYVYAQWTLYTTTTRVQSTLDWSREVHASMHIAYECIYIQIHTTMFMVRTAESSRQREKLRQKDRNVFFYYWVLCLLFAHSFAYNNFYRSMLSSVAM